MFMIEAVRSLGMAARFVSGYLHVRADSESHSRGGNTHAWVQVYIPGSGWVDFDPSSGIAGNRDLAHGSASLKLTERLSRNRRLLPAALPAGRI
jgi:hypothetical protein